MSISASSSETLRNVNQSWDGCPWRTALISGVWRVLGMGATLRFGRGRRKRGVGLGFLDNGRRELFGLQSCRTWLTEDNRMPAQTLTTTELHPPLGDKNFTID